jgi:hypothetical protein
MYKGSCLCGTVQFEISGEIHDIVYCHCSLCRKAQGSAYATNGNVKKVDFKFISGIHNLTEYMSPPGQTKFFCKTCGSPIMSENSTRPDKIRVRLGTIESNITERPGCHIFVASKASWDVITDDLPQHEGYEPEL